jgi:hypothetical protein
VIRINLQCVDVDKLWLRARQRAHYHKTKTDPKRAAKRKAKRRKHYVQIQSDPKRKEARRLHNNHYKCATLKTERGRNQKLSQRLRAKYKVSLSAVREQLLLQGGVCDVCRKLIHIGGRGRDRACVDHSHRTGKIRGLLCSACNVALGMAREDVNILCALAEYLEKYKEDAA